MACVLYLFPEKLKQVTDIILMLPNLNVVLLCSIIH